MYQAEFKTIEDLEKHLTDKGYRKDRSNPIVSKCDFIMQKILAETKEETSKLSFTFQCWDKNKEPYTSHGTKGASAELDIYWEFADKGQPYMRLLLYGDTVDNLEAKGLEIVQQIINKNINLNKKIWI